MTTKEFNGLKPNDYIMYTGHKNIYKVIRKIRLSSDGYIYYQISCINSNSTVNAAMSPEGWKKLSQLDKVKFL